LDPFLGSGTTAAACILEDRDCIGIEREPAYLAIARRRVIEAEGPLFASASTRPGPAANECRTNAERSNDLPNDSGPVADP
jgi:hypothetical protein